MSPLHNPKRWTLIFPIIGFAMICGIIVMANIKSTPGIMPDFLRFQFSDKLGHFGIYGLFTICLTYFTSASQFKLWHQPVKPAHLVWSFWLFALVEECSQMFIATRSFEWLDLLADTTGIFLGYKVGVLLYNKLTTRLAVV